MRLPIGPEWGEVEEPLTLPLGVDPAGVDWTTVRRSAYLIHQRISYRYAAPVQHLRQRLVVQPREHHGDQRRISRRLRVINAEPRRVTDVADGFGNNVVDISIPRVEEEVTFISWSIVERDLGFGSHLTAGSWLGDPRLLTPTRLTTPGDELRHLARELAARGASRVDLADAVCEATHAAMHYAHGVTGVGTTAAEAFDLRAGVCQDFAHVMLAVTRELGLPSRYVSGQLIGTGGSHAWVEVLVPDGRGRAAVVSLDPTHNCRTGMTYLTIAIGRDYCDVAPLSGSYRAGPAGSLTTNKSVSVVRIDSDLPETETA